MINRTTLAVLGAVTFALFVAGAAIGEDNDVLWIVDDIVFIGFILCALALVLSTNRSARSGTSLVNRL